MVTFTEDLDAALRGDEQAELRTMVRSLATQLCAVVTLVKDEEVVRTSVELAKAALDYLDK